MPRSSRSWLTKCCAPVALRALLIPLAPAFADTAAAPAPPDAQQEQQRLAGDYFVGASVFLFERTVLAAFAPADASPAALDAGAVTLASENAGDEAGSVALDAMTGWLNAWFGADKNGADKTGLGNAPPGFDADRRRGLACLIFGADPDNRGDLAQHAGLSSDERDACVTRYTGARKDWEGWLEVYRKPPGSPPTLSAEPAGAAPEEAAVLRLVFAPTVDEGDQAVADALKANGLFQVLTDDLNATLTMPRPMTALLTQCGEPKAFYNADRGEAVLCYEMLTALLKAAP